MISEKYKCFFIHIPKTGGKSVEKAFKQHGDHKPYNRLKLHPKWNEWHSFSIVRNPWDRMVSAYHYIKKINEHPFKHGMSFNSFLHNSRFIKRKGEYDPRFWWIRQYEWIVKNDRLVVDEVLKFENLNYEFSKFAKKIGFKESLPHTNKSSHSHYSNYYTEKSKMIIDKWFQKDIEFFNYKFERKNVKLL